MVDKDFGLNFSASLVMKEDGTVDCGVNYSDSDGNKVNSRQTGDDIESMVNKLSKDFVSKYLKSAAKVRAAKKAEADCKAKERLAASLATKGGIVDNTAHKDDIEKLNKRLDELEKQKAELEKKLEDVSKSKEQKYAPTKKVDGKDVPLTYGRKDEIDSSIDDFLKFFGLY